MLTALGDEANVYPIDIKRIPILCQEVSSMSLESRVDKAEVGLVSHQVTIDTLRAENELLKDKLAKLATLVEGLVSCAGVAVAVVSPGAPTVSPTDLEPSHGSDSNSPVANEGPVVEANHVTSINLSSTASIPTHENSNEPEIVDLHNSTSQPNQSNPTQLTLLSQQTPLTPSSPITSSASPAPQTTLTPPTQLTPVTQLTPPTLPASRTSSTPATLPTQSTNNTAKKHRPKLTGQEKHTRHVNATLAGVTAVTRAIRGGMNEKDAETAGLNAAADFARSYASTADPNTTTRTGAVGGSAASPQSGLASSQTPKYSLLPPGGKKKHSSQYEMGTGTSTPAGLSLAYRKPDYLKNKVLVVSRMDKNMKGKLFQDFIDDKAKKHIELLHVQQLNKVISTYSTIAIELNDENYELLSDSSFWEGGIAIKPWIGRRWWRGAPRHSAETIKNSMRQQWLTS